VDALLGVSASMRFLSAIFLFGTFFSLNAFCAPHNTFSPACISFADASKHLGPDQCVRGTVVHVENGGKGATFLSFCKESKACPFTVVVFPADLKKMGDVRQLEGKQIEIKGTIQDHDGRSEIILRRSKQLGDGAFLLFPQVLTDYDVEHQGRNSAGKYSHPKSAKKTDTKQGDSVSLEDPGEPQ
jgi:DNA/RNA endonuclease YhcR with UshA esterase domain